MNSKSKRRRVEGRKTAGHPAAPPVVPAVVLAPGRKWLFRLLIVFVLPLIVLAAAELGLRLFGVGFDPHFFKRQTIGGQDYYVANDSFGLRFFPRNLARTPAPVVMPAAKAPGTYRIFIFGESAALGEPRPNYGAGSFLEVLLGERFPETKFEVINTSMTAINSHAILPIARECAGHAGDLWIIYMGNNEMVGPFGAATVFGGRTPPLWLVRVKLELQRLRLVQLALEVGQRFRQGNSASPGWQGMEMFMQSQVAPGDSRKQKVYQNFKRNLDDLLAAGHAAGARIILSTVAVNLKACPPFASLSGDDLPETARAALGKLARDGAEAMAQGRLAEAKSQYEQAVEMYPEAAEPHFQLATCLLSLTNPTAARTHFVKAVDTDTLPFRTDSRINEEIRAAARPLTGDSLTLYDAAEALGRDNPDGIPGDEIFYEHVHFNPNGNYALARGWADQVEKQLAPALKRGARPAWASPAECEQLLGLTDWNRVSMLEEILERLQRPPFRGQTGNARQVARLQGEIEALRKQLTSAAAAAARATYARALRRAPEDHRLHENQAEFLEALHELKPAIIEREKVCALIPYTYFPYYALGVDLKEAGELAEARKVLSKAAALKPDQGEVRLELGVVCARLGEWEQARQELEKSRRLDPVDPRVPLYLGEVLWKLERRSEALASLREAIQLDPTDWQPHYRLAGNLAQAGNFTDAAAEYAATLRLNPTHIKTKLGLAAVLLNLGREPEAMQQLDEILIQEPGNPAAAELRNRIRPR